VRTFLIRFPNFQFTGVVSIVHSNDVIFTFAGVVSVTLKSKLIALRVYSMATAMIFDDTGVPESLVRFDDAICLGEDDSALFTLIFVNSCLYRAQLV